MTQLYQLARSGLAAAQAGLDTTGHNIANSKTPGFSRQQVMVSTAGAQPVSSGYIGRGVQIDTVRRLHDTFLNRQLDTAISTSNALQTSLAQLTQINNLLADRTAGVAPALTKMFDSMDAVASTPANPESRQEFLGRATTLATQLNIANSFMDDQREGVNREVASTVAEINSYAERIRDLNERIVTARASVQGQPPNDLLDQRDQLVRELNERVRVQVTEQGDQINLSIGNGQTLLSGTKVFPLATQASEADPRILAVAYTSPSGVVVELPDSAIEGGSLGGLLEYRSTTLARVQNELGRVALGVALAYNEQQAQGVGLTGSGVLSVAPVTALQPGVASPLVSVDTVVARQALDGASQGSYTLTPPAAAGAPWVVEDAAGNPVTVTQSGDELSFNGIKVDTSVLVPTGTPPDDITLNVNLAANDIFGFEMQPALTNARNDKTVNASLTPVSFDSSALTIDDYRVTYRDDGTGTAGYFVTNLTSGQTQQVTPNADGQFTLGGVTLQVAVDAPATTPALGDSWLFQPTRNAAGTLNVVMTDPGQVAAASPRGGSANGENALKLAQLRSEKILAGDTMNLSEGYAQLVNRVGIDTNRMQVASDAQDALTHQAQLAQQSVSGVNLNEEYINLDSYVQYYNASARLIAVATNLFDTLLGLRT